MKNEKETAYGFFMSCDNIMVEAEHRALRELSKEEQKRFDELLAGLYNSSNTDSSQVFTITTSGGA